MPRVLKCSQCGLQEPLLRKDDSGLAKDIIDHFHCLYRMKDTLRGERSREVAQHGFVLDFPVLGFMLFNGRFVAGLRTCDACVVEVCIEAELSRIASCQLQPIDVCFVI